MTDGDKLELAEKLAGVEAADSDSSSLLADVYLPAAMWVILEARNPFDAELSESSWEARYDCLQCEIAVDLFNRRGAEGEVSHKENGVDRTWASANVSRALMQRIVPKAKVVG